MDTLTAIQGYMSCFPYMKTHALVLSLNTSWEQVCKRNDLLKDKTHKRILQLKADAKAEAEVVEKAEAAKADAIATCTRGNLVLYRMRALKKVYERREKEGHVPAANRRGRMSLGLKKPKEAAKKAALEESTTDGDAQDGVGGASHEPHGEDEDAAHPHGDEDEHGQDEEEHHEINFDDDEEHHEEHHDEEHNDEAEAVEPEPVEGEDQ